MNMNPLFMAFLSIFLATWTCSNLLAPPKEQLSQANQESNTFITSISDEAAADGLNLQALPAVLQEAKTPEELEKKLNEPDGINNLDINNDGVVDYINVQELNNSENNSHGFVLSTEVEPNQIQDIATIEVKQEDDKVTVDTYGNNSIYGSNANYSSSFPFGTFLLMSYFLSPHSLFSSPYGYGGNYPNTYRPYNNASKSDYLNRASRFEQNSTSAKTSNSKSSFNRTPRNADTGIKKSLKNPTTSQRSFRTREMNKATKSGAFGRQSTSTKTGVSRFGGNSSSSVRSFSSSRRGFGGFGK